MILSLERDDFTADKKIALGIKSGHSGMFVLFGLVHLNRFKLFVIRINASTSRTATMSPLKLSAAGSPSTRDDLVSWVIDKVIGIDQSKPLANLNEETTLL